MIEDAGIRVEGSAERTLPRERRLDVTLKISPIDAQGDRRQLFTGTVVRPGRRRHPRPMAQRPIVPAELTTGVFTVADARRAGLTWKQLQSATWRRVGDGLYMWAKLGESPMLLLAAIQRDLPAVAAFSGRTAAWLHGLDLPLDGPIEVTVPPSCGISARAGTSVRRAALPECDVVERRGVRATSALRTVADLARRLPLVEAVVVADMALRQRLVDLEALTSYVAARPRRWGIAHLRRVAELAEPRAESPMETRLRMLLVLAGLPRPEAQVPLHDDSGRFLGRPDLYYPGPRVALEYDGSTHRDSLVQDNRRQNRLLNAGVRLLRFTAADLRSTPDLTIAQVRRALDVGDLPRRSPSQPHAKGRSAGRPP